MRRILALVGIIAVAVLLAFPLRNAIYEAVIIPAAYLLWVLGLVYHSVHQSLWWIVVIVIVLFIVSRSMLPETKPIGARPVNTKPVVGQVESLAVWVKKSERSTYFKWLLANRLGRIAYQILAQREAGKRSVFAPLTGADWNPGEGLQSYLESGLHGSFADFPHANRFFSQPKRTPLDHNVNEAIEFLESQVDQ